MTAQLSLQRRNDGQMATSLAVRAPSELASGDSISCQRLGTMFAFQRKSDPFLLDIISKGSTSARSIMRANVLLAADENSPNCNKTEAEIAGLFNVHQQDSIV